MIPRSVPEFWLRLVSALLGSLVIILIIAKCAACNPKTGADVGKEVACILSKETEPVQQIAVDCADGAVQVVEDILAAHRAATAAERQRAAADGGVK